MNRKLILLFSTLFFIAFTENIYAQTPRVAVSLSIVPPYSPYLSTYQTNPGKVMITVRRIDIGNTQTLNVKLRGTLSSDNGISATTKTGFKPALPIVLAPNAVKVLILTDYKDYFDAGNLNYAGINLRGVVNGGILPAGNYTACFQALDYTTEAPYSQLNDGCFNFLMTYPEPPQTIAPVCGDSIYAVVPQNIVFNWQPSIAGGAVVQYDFTMVELPAYSSFNPNDALNNATYPIFYQQKNIAANSLVYGNNLPQLQAGKKYAWRVRAHDAGNLLLFKSNGYSDVCTFKYKAAIFVVNNNTPVINLGSNNTDKSQNQGNNKSLLSGKASYYFTSITAFTGDDDKKKPRPKTYQLVNTKVQLIQVTTIVPVYRVYKLVGQKKVKKNGIESIINNYAWVDSIPSHESMYNSMPLINTKPNPADSRTAKNGTVLATTTTDEAGNFTFNFTGDFESIILDSGYVDNQGNFNMEGKGQKLATVTGLWVRYDNPYYYFQEEVFFLGKNGKLDEQKTYAQAKNYALKVKLTDYYAQKDYYNNKLIPQQGNYNNTVTMYLLRKKLSKETPRNECNLSGNADEKVIDNTKYYVMAKKDANINQSVTFFQLIQNVKPGDDDYYLYAESKSGKHTLYGLEKYSYNDCPFNNCFETLNFDINYSKYIIKDAEVKAYQTALSITGKLKYNFSNDNGNANTGAAKPLAHTNLKLVKERIIRGADGTNYPIQEMGEVGAGITNADGEFSIQSGWSFEPTLLGSDFQNNYGNSSGTYYDKNGDAITVSGKAFYVLRLIVQSPYYYSPNNDFLVESGYDYQVGTLYADVRECNTTITGIRAVNLDLPFYDAGGLFNPLLKSGERVYLCVKKNSMPENFPMDKDKIFSLTKKEIENGGITYTVIDEATSISGGIVNFKHAVLNDPNNTTDHYYYFSESPQNSFDNYSSECLGSMNKLTDLTFEQKKYFNSSQFIKTFNKQRDLHDVSFKQSLITFAQQPVIFGAVYPNSNYSTNPLQGVKVEVFDIPQAAFDKAKQFVDGFSAFFFKGILAKDYGITMPESYQYTGADGNFKFPINTTIPGKTNVKLVCFSKNGFIPTGVFVNDKKQLTKGQRAALNKIFMELPIHATGKVIDEETGKYIHAKVVVGENFSWSETKELFGGPPNFNVNGQELKLDCPTGDVTFHVYSDDNNTYEPLEQYEKISIFGNAPVFTFKVKHRKHQLIFTGYSIDKGVVGANIPIKATVVNMDPPIVSTLIDGVDGQMIPKQVKQAKLNFSSATTSFLIKVEALNSPNETKYINITDAATGVVKLPIYLNVVKKIKCHVKDAAGNPLANIRIGADDLPYTVPVVYTDVNGNAELIGVPATGSHTLVALPPDNLANYIGDTKQINMDTYADATIQFKVKYFDVMDITKLLGYPMKVKKMTVLLNHCYINGSVAVNPTSNIFSIPNVAIGLDNNPDKNFDFDGLEIFPSTTKGQTGLPLASVKKDFCFTTSIKSLKTFNTYLSYAYSPIGIVAHKLDDQHGNILGTVCIEPGSFKSGYTVAGAPNNIFISNTNYNGITNGINIAEFLTLFDNNGSSPFNNASSFKISTGNYKAPLYFLHNRYVAEAKIDGSSFNKNGLHLNTIIHTYIPQLQNPDIAFKAGVIDIATDETQPKLSNDAVDIALDKWKFAIKSWTLNASGLYVKGDILAGALAVPAEDVLIESGNFNYGKYKVDNIKLGGNIPLNINPNNTSISFGFDQGYNGGQGSWSLSMLPLSGDVLTSLGNLPGLDATDKINIKNISLYSKGSDDENVISLSSNSTWVTLYNVSKFHPTSAFATTGAINFRGSLDLMIPQLSEMADAFTLRYEAGNNGLKLLPPDQPFSGFTLKTKGITVTFNDKNQKFESNNLTLHGKITDQDPNVGYSFDVTLTKGFLNSSLITVDNTNQKYTYAGNAGLENVTGSMGTLNKAEWGRFKFEGDMFGLAGIADANKHLKFEVKGDLVADNSKVGVNNVAVDGLGSGSITYDFDQKALIGSLHVDQDLSNCHLMGDMNLKFGGGDWYVFGSSIMSNIKDAPVNTLNAGFFVGKGSISGDIQKVLAHYFYKEQLPDPFPKGAYTGALFCAEAAVPVPIIPQINIPLDPLVHVTLEHAIHFNFYNGIGISLPTVTYDFGGQIYVYVHAGAGASIGLACAGADLSATAGGGMYGHVQMDVPAVALNPVQMMSNVKQAILDAGITAQGEAFLNLQGSAYVGGGLCDSDCDGWFCETVSWSKGMDIRLAATYTRPPKSSGLGSFGLEFKDLHFH